MLLPAGVAAAGVVVVIVDDAAVATAVGVVVGAAAQITLQCMLAISVDCAHIVELATPSRSTCFEGIYFC